ncbi:MAG: PIN domain nuclease [SAR86 cluster bacterium]|uniref:PIN domain nuclease n=1 Tax=SAR86 cluster bacterium TaxID=2030880 RepID=A0A2A5AFM0_9GAMM|nr:MAG: PIN domain nuclease [SAR86 cluster bacterium]
MNIIIDTHIYLWALSDPEKLTPNFRAELETPTNTIFVSAITVAEIMIKSSIGKLDVSFDPEEMATRSGFELLDFSARDALPLKELPFHHRDPFDRMLISQGISRDYNLMTQDPKFGMYDCKLLV